MHRDVGKKALYILWQSQRFVHKIWVLTWENEKASSAPNTEVAACMFTLSPVHLASCIIFKWHITGASTIRVMGLAAASTLTKGCGEDLGIVGTLHTAISGECFVLHFLRVHGKWMYSLQAHFILELNCPVARWCSICAVCPNWCWICQHLAGVAKCDVPGGRVRRSGSWAKVEGSGAEAEARSHTEVIGRHAELQLSEEAYIGVGVSHKQGVARRRWVIPAQDSHHLRLRYARQVQEVCLLQHFWGSNRHKMNGRFKERQNRAFFLPYFVVANELKLSLDCQDTQLLAAQSSP